MLRLYLKESLEDGIVAHTDLMQTVALQLGKGMLFMWAALWFGEHLTLSFTQHIQVPMERESSVDGYTAIKIVSHENTPE